MQEYEEGLAKAYATPDGLYRDGNKLYVAGTRNMGHVAEWWKIPFYQVESSEIYRNMDKYLSENPEIDTLIGHSYGSAAALHKQKQNSRYNTIAYNSPVFDTDAFTKHNVVRRVNRHANALDPVAMFDFSANRSFIPSSLNPHSYTNAPKKSNGYFDNNFVSYRDKRMKY